MTAGICKAALVPVALGLLTSHRCYINGIEVFTPGGTMKDVAIGNDDDPSNSWCFEVVKRFLDRPELLSSATYSDW